MATIDWAEQGRYLKKIAQNINSNSDVECLDHALITLRERLFDLPQDGDWDLSHIDFRDLNSDQFLARGIDTLRAGLAIYLAQFQDQLTTSALLASHSSSHDSGYSSESTPKQEDSVVQRLVAKFLDFVTKLTQYATQADWIKLCLAACEQFNADIITCCWPNQLPATPAKLGKSIAFVRDVRYKQAFSQKAAKTRFNTIAATRSYTPLSLAKPSELLSSTAWARALVAQWGSWVKPFIDANQDTLAKPQTPFQRFSPTAAGVYQVTTRPDVPTALSSTTTSVAISEPYERYKTFAQKLQAALGVLDQQVVTETCAIHKQLFAEEDRLAQFVKDYLHKLEKQGSVITVPIFYQTLIADDIPGVPDWQKTSQALNYKTVANRWIRQLLNKEYYWHKVDETFVAKSDENTLTVHFELLETNNCVNCHHKYSTIRNQDLSHSRRLVQLAREQLIKSWGEHPNENQKVLLAFLSSRDYSVFTPYKYRGDTVKRAVAAVKSSDANADLLLAAAVELKCLVHETYLGAARRWLHQALPAIPMLRWLGIALSFVLASVVKGFVAPVLLRSWLRHHETRRKTVYKAVYEQLVAECLGAAVFSGCMSALDRAEEVSLLSSAMLLHFNKLHAAPVQSSAPHHTRMLLGYNDAPADKQAVLDEYAELLRAKRVKAFLASGVSVNSEREMRFCGFGFLGRLFGRSAGLLQERQTPKQLAEQAQASPLRKNTRVPH